MSEKGKSERTIYEQNEDMFSLSLMDMCLMPCEKPMSIEDGYWKMKNERGYIDLEFWARVTDQSIDQLLEQTAGTYIWQDPIRYDFSGCDKYMGWLSKEQYLMGNIVKKYKEARLYHEKYGLFEENLKLLKENLPEIVEGEDIHVNLVAPWIRSIKGFIERFIAELLDMETEPFVYYDSLLGEAEIEYRSKPNPVLNLHTYGTLKTPATEIIRMKIKGRILKRVEYIPKVDGRGYTAVLDQEETTIIQEKGREIDKQFSDFCHEDKENESLLPEAYMHFFGYGVCRFDGSRFSFLDAEKKITLHNHQKDAIVHSLEAPYVLFADCTGAGKTVEYCVSTHEQLRLGLSSKAMIVVPKASLNAVYETYRKLFMDDRVLYVRPEKEFSPVNRKDSIRKIKEGDYQVIIMSSTSFDMLKLSKNYILKMKDTEIQETKIKMSYEANLHLAHRLKKYLDQLAKERAELEESYRDIDLCCFDELGVDLLVVDEAHHYKNISLDYAVENVVGMHKKGSKKADCMLEKVGCIQRKQGRIIFATATPLPNSLADLYVLQRYLQPEELRINNLYHFNEWIHTFCEEEYSFEMDVDCVNGRFMTRFSRFHNLPELMAMFSQVCHFYQGGKELGLPEFKGYTDVLVKQSEELKVYMEEIAARAEAVRNNDVDKKQDNFLKIIIQGRLAPLDIRLVIPESSAEGENKVQVSARTIANFFFKYPECTQIAFSDLSTPKEGFNIYDELRKALVEQGVPSDQIMFIHDADNARKRTEVERLFNQGKVRILVGSTKKLGTGVNVQERLKAIHMLDVPWRPADFEQRCGRIVRQGNTCEEVFIFRYVTERSFDAYTYQILENKQKFISQFLSGTLSILHRSETDCADTILTYAEIKALAIGNPLIKQRVELANQLERIKIHQRQRKKEMLRLEEILYHMPKQIEKRKRLIMNTKHDWIHYEEHKQMVGREERIALGEELIWALCQNVMNDKERVFCEYQGAEIVLPKHMKAEKPYILLKFKGSNQYSVNMDTDKSLGCCQRLDHCLEGLSKRQEYHEKQLQLLYDQEQRAQKELLLGNKYDAEVQRLALNLKEIDTKLKEGAE